jgi:hypothetical protein
MRRDRPDFKLTLNGVEASIGEVTGYHQRADKSKNGFDLWRLARYGKFVLNQGYIWRLYYKSSMTREWSTE